MNNFLVRILEDRIFQIYFLYRPYRIIYHIAYQSHNALKFKEQNEAVKTLSRRAQFG